MRRRTLIALLLAVAAFALPAVPAAAYVTKSTTTDVVVYVGQLGATAYTQSLNGVLDTQGSILATEQQIADMSNRIVYVTQISQSGSIEIIYLAASLVQLGFLTGTPSYRIILVPVAALPTGW